MQGRRRRLEQQVTCVAILLTAASILWAVSSMSSVVLHRAQPRAAVQFKLGTPDRNQSNASMPRIVHQSWKTRQLPTRRAERWSASWKTCFPDWEWRLWTDEDNLALIREHYPWFLPVYLGFRYPVERADLARYFYMFHYGGIYADLDTVCLRNFTHLLQSASIIFGGMDDDHDDAVLHSLVQNSFIASRPGHQFWMRLIRRIEANSKARKVGRPEDLTGPNVLMSELRVYLTSNNATDVRIFPGRYFNPFSWKLQKNNPKCKDFGRMSDTEEAACIATFPDAYIVQIHAQSWGKGRM